MDADTDFFFLCIVDGGRLTSDLSLWSYFRCDRVQAGIILVCHIWDVDPNYETLWNDRYPMSQLARTDAE